MNDNIINKDEALKIVKQMKEDNKTYSDFWTEYYEGTNTTYNYDSSKKSFIRNQIDIIAGSFSYKSNISEEEMIAYIMKDGVKTEFRSQGFDFD